MYQNQRCEDKDVRIQAAFLLQTTEARTLDTSVRTLTWQYGGCFLQRPPEFPGRDMGPSGGKEV